MTRSGLSRRVRLFLLWSARLALVAYLVQLSAIDHWHTHFSDVTGVEGSANHALHCHGAGDCSSEGGAALSVFALPALLPSPGSGVSFHIDPVSQQTPAAAFITPPSEPPQAA